MDVHVPLKDLRVAVTMDVHFLPNHERCQILERGREWWLWFVRSPSGAHCAETSGSDMRVGLVLATGCLLPEYLLRSFPRAALACVDSNWVHSLGGAPLSSRIRWPRLASRKFERLLCGFDLPRGNPPSTSRPHAQNIPRTRFPCRRCQSQRPRPRHKERRPT